jgi:hypothetical protein
MKVRQEVGVTGTTHHQSHLCVFSHGENEHRAAVLPYIADGLKIGQQCVYVTDSRSVEDWQSELQAGGIDVGQEAEKGSLRVTASWSSTGPREYNSVELARRLWARIERGVAEFGAVRYAVDMATALDAGTPLGALCHWEATLNPLVEGAPVEIRCLYNLRTLPEPAIRCALRTHPIVMIGDGRFINPHYEALRILENEARQDPVDLDEPSVEEMLAALSPLT